VVPSTMISHCRSTCEDYLVTRRPWKLNPWQRLLNFILFMKHDNVTRYDYFMQNWSKSSMWDDVLFISSCINASIVDEIRWPTIKERATLGTHLPKLPICIWFIDGTLVEIQKCWKNQGHRSWFNGWKKIYAMNNIVVFDHTSLFIYI
jgi:hypothetical protein